MIPRLAVAALAASTALPALAEVNIYSTRQPDLIQPIADAFTEETGIAVNIAHLEDGLVERMRAEGERSPVDLVLTVDIARLTEVVDAELTQPVESEVLTQAIPETLRDPENQWFGVTTRARVVYAANDRVADEDVTTYEDLASDEWEGRICTRSGTHQYNVALAAAMIVHHGEDYTKEWLEGLKANLARKPQGGDREQVKAIWAGECDIAIGNTYYMGQMLNNPEQKEWADSVRLLFPTFEEGGTHLNVSGVAMARNAANREDALRFMEFLVSTEAQTIYAEDNNEYPVVEGVSPSEVVSSWGEFDADAVDLAEIADARAAALRLMEEVNFDG